MATIFQSKRIECKLKTVEAVDSGEHFGAEPYFWPFFYKIDGETVEAQINIDFLEGMEIKLVGEPTVLSKVGSHGNLAVLDHGEITTVKNIDGRFRSDFDPMPVKINVNLGSFAEEIITDVLIELDELVTLIDGDRKCPPIEIDAEELGEFAAEFISGTLGGIPGICGVTYILMEEDFTSESAAEETRIAIKTTIKNQLQGVINDLKIKIEFPMNLNGLLARLTDLLDTEEDIVDEATDSAISIILKDVIFQMLKNGLIGAGIAGGSMLVFGIQGLPLVIPAAAIGFVIGAIVGADFDDILGSASGLITHFDDNDFALSFVPQTTDHGQWKITGEIKFR